MAKVFWEGCGMARAAAVRIWHVQQQYGSAKRLDKQCRRNLAALCTFSETGLVGSPAQEKNLSQHIRYPVHSIDSVLAILATHMNNCPGLASTAAGRRVIRRTGAVRTCRENPDSFFYRLSSERLSHISKKVDQRVSNWFQLPSDHMEAFTQLLSILM